MARGEPRLSGRTGGEGGTVEAEEGIRPEIHVGSALPLRYAEKMLSAVSQLREVCEIIIEEC